MIGVGIGIVRQIRQSNVFSPSDIAGLQYWYRASSIVGTDGENVLMTDSSGNGRHTTQATVIQRPILRTGGNGINGVNAVEFDGTTQALNIPSLTIPQPFTAFFVFKNTKINPDTSFSEIWTNQTFAFNPAVYANSGASKELSVFAGTVVNSGFNCEGMTESIGTFIFNGASSKILVNNSDVGGIINPGVGGINHVMILGNDRADGSGTQGFKGLLAEHFLYDSELSTPVITQINQYLSDIYAIPI